MGTDQTVFGVALVVALVALGAVYAWRSLRTLRQLRAPGEPVTPEDLYRRTQARWRLVGSGLLFLLAVLLGGALAYLEGPAERQAQRADARAAERAAGGQPEPTEEERSFAFRYGTFWVVFLVVLLVVLVLAFLDQSATRRFAVQAHRQLQTELRNAVEQEAARLRQEKRERNGHA